MTTTQFQMMTRLLCVWSALFAVQSFAEAAEFSAGVGKIDITNYDAGPANDKMHARALVLKQGDLTAVFVSVDAVAIEQIGPIKSDYLPKVRAALEKDLKIDPARVLVNASHCHGIVCSDVAERTVQAVKQAAQNLVPVKIGTGVGQEDRIMENRRIKMKNGKEIDIRRAYSMPPDDEIAGVGPVDPQIGILRIDRMDGKPLAVLYNFACHPIQGVPSGGNTADMTGFSSQAIEDALPDGAVALFVQGCGGDINPAKYKDFDSPKNAEALGNMLGFSVLRALKKIETKADGDFKFIRQIITLPRADLAERIDQLETEQMQLVRSLEATNLNLKAFIPLMVKYKVNPEFPSYSAQYYLHEKSVGRNELEKLDAANRLNLEKYVKNVQIMEQLTRLQTNLALLKMHQAQNIAAGKRTIDVEVLGVRIGDFVLVTFPGELTVQIGLNIKKSSPHPQTFVAGYTNGYIYYAPTEEQLRNVGGAQEDSDCILAPEWHKQFEEAVAKLLKKL